MLKQPVEEVPEITSLTDRHKGWMGKFSNGMKRLGASLLDLEGGR